MYGISTENKWWEHAGEEAIICLRSTPADHFPHGAIHHTFLDFLRDVLLSQAFGRQCAPQMRI